MPAAKKTVYKGISGAAKARAAMSAMPGKSYQYPIQKPHLPPGVVPAKAAAPVLAMDGPYWDAGIGYALGAGGIDWNGFPGYQYLAMLATRAEYRALAGSFSTELVREWITLTSTATDDDTSADKIPEIMQALEDMGLRDSIQLLAEHDCFFGRAQLFVDIVGQKRDLPLIISNKTIKQGAAIRMVPVEPMWTTPNAYNAIDPAAPDFYKPVSWWMLGQQVHASRLLTIISRPVPDMLKPAFNFSGISLSQLAEAYVDNWLRTRKSVSDLISNFSITAIKTSMSALLQGSADGASLFDRADFFNATRANRGLMLIDMNEEDLVQLNVPLGGLHELQAQAQEGMCAVGKTPSTILLGVAPSGFGNVAAGEMDAWANWISANQESDYRPVIDIALKLVQLSLYGEIDDDISFTFNPLRQMTRKELAEIRASDAQASAAYVDRSVTSPEEERARLARDPDSGYEGLDVEQLPDSSGAEEDDEVDQE